MRGGGGEILGTGVYAVASASARLLDNDVSVFVVSLVLRRSQNLQRRVVECDARLWPVVELN